jgi:hypothetical protein
MRISIPRPSPALVIAALALGLVLGGTGYATGLAVPKNSVGTAQLQNGAVTTKKLASNAVTSSQVKNASLLRGDFKPGQLPAGPPGPQGPQGPAGPPGISGLQRFDVLSTSNSSSPKTAIAACPTGKRPVGGGARVIGSGANVVSIIENFPDSDTVHWNAKASEVVATALAWQLQVYALCATVAG